MKMVKIFGVVLVLLALSGCTRHYSYGKSCGGCGSCHSTSYHIGCCK